MVEISESLMPYLKEVYGEGAGRIVDELRAFVARSGLRPCPGKPPEWHRQMRMYTVRPDGIRYDGALSPLRNLIAHLPLVRRMHFNALHILPFWASPLHDMGYDISDYYRIREGLGSMEDLRALVAEADRLGMHLVIDAVFNHVSEASVWFERAQAGELRYRNYFLHTRENPRFIRKVEKANLVAAEYDLEGTRVQVDISFPELTGPIPHWRLGRDGVWYYHSYLPQEMDLDWFNPDVFVEMAKVMMTWGSMGFNFRLDAIPFVGKPAYKRLSGDDPTNHNLVMALKGLCDKVHPGSIFIAETYEQIPHVARYFGVNGTPESRLAYGFHLCTSLWVGMVKRNVDPIWRTLGQAGRIPGHGQWLNFLRNHDELSLAHLPGDVAREVHQSLLRFGKDFREGHGISGRTFSLLGCSRARFRMAYFLLASLPGSLMLLFGDEIGMKNNKLTAFGRAERRDTRNINRGILDGRLFRTESARESMAFFARLFQARADVFAFLETPPKRIDAPRDLLLVEYRLGARTLLACINLGPRMRTFPLGLDGFAPILTVNEMIMDSYRLRLGPYGGVWLTNSLPG